MQYILDNWQSATVASLYMSKASPGYLTVEIQSPKGVMQWYMYSDGKIADSRAIYFDGGFYKIPYEFDKQFDDIAAQITIMHKLCS